MVQFFLLYGFFVMHLNRQNSKAWPQRQQIKFTTAICQDRVESVKVFRQKETCGYRTLSPSNYIHVQLNFNLYCGKHHHCLDYVEMQQIFLNESSATLINTNRVTGRRVNDENTKCMTVILQTWVWLQSRVWDQATDRGSAKCGTGYPQNLLVRFVEWSSITSSVSGSAWLLYPMLTRPRQTCLKYTNTSKRKYSTTSTISFFYSSKSTKLYL